MKLDLGRSFIGEENEKRMASGFRSQAMNNASTVKKTLLVSTYHFYLDPSNGAAITTRELLPYYPESFCRVAAEAMANGIPVIVSSRGALPEVVGDAGIIIDIPSRLLDDVRIVRHPIVLFC